MTTDEVAGQMHVHKRTVREWIRNGDLRASRTPGRNGRYRISNEALEDFMRASQQKPQEEGNGDS